MQWKEKNRSMSRTRMHIRYIKPGKCFSCQYEDFPGFWCSTCVAADRCCPDFLPAALFLSSPVISIFLITPYVSARYLSCTPFRKLRRI